MSILRLLIDDGATECHNAKELGEDLMEYLVPLVAILVTIFFIHLNPQGYWGCSIEKNSLRTHLGSPRFSSVVERFKKAWRYRPNRT